MFTAKKDFMTQNTRQADAAIALEQIVAVREDLKDMKQEMGEKISKLETKLDNQYVLRIEYASLERRVKKVEEDKDWLNKAFWGAVIASAVGFFITFSR